MSCAPFPGQVLTGLPLPGIHVCSIYRLAGACETAVNLVSMEIAHHPPAAPSVPSGPNSEVLRPARTDTTSCRSQPALRVIDASANRHEARGAKWRELCFPSARQSGCRESMQPGATTTPTCRRGAIPFCFVETSAPAPNRPCLARTQPTSRPLGLSRPPMPRDRD